MASPNSSQESPATLFTRRNVLLLVVALATIGAGYAVLSGGSASAGTAAVLLVVGYCILFPLALIA